MHDVILHGLSLRLEGSDAVLSRAREVLAHFGAEPTEHRGRPAVVLAFEVGSVPVPDPRERRTATHLDVTVARDDAGIVLRSPSGTTRIDPTGGCSHTRVTAEGPLPLHLFTCILVHQLRLRGWYTLHAACVVQDGRGCLIVGPSGTGKSTLALSLVLQGWKLVSDDSVLLARAGGGLEVLALRRGIFLDPATSGATGHPPGRWRPCPLLEGSKQELVLDGLERVDRTWPALIVLPQLVDRADSDFAPVDIAEATFALSRESRLTELDRDGAPVHLAMLGALAGQAPAVRAYLGRDVLGGAAPVSDRLAAWVKESP